MMQHLRQLMKAYDRYSRAVRGPYISESELDQTFERLLLTIKKEWSNSLDHFFETARENALKEYSEAADGVKDEADILKKEADLLNELKADAKKIQWFFSIYRENSEASDKSPATSRELETRLRSLHQLIKEEISDSRQLPRKKKKKRKRQVARGITSLTVGVGAFIANTNLPPIMAWSYGVGAGALHQAARDFVGEKKE
ncbi:MAG: hypothetical protein V2J62_01860 [candidate division KSB1 bacterium]|jgi:hypothetical protein|nr:hypothetical protein [candidate division KSB1 bacterium]